MICALMIGRARSKGFPGKNTTKVLEKKLCEYPLMAAKKSNNINKIFVSTDCPEIKKIGIKYQAEIISRPANLATNQALGEDVFQHGYVQIKNLLAQEKAIDFGIERETPKLKADEKLSIKVNSITKIAGKTTVTIESIGCLPCFFFNLIPP